MYLNKVYADPYSEPPATLRVVFEHSNYLMLIDVCDVNAWPYSISISEFESLELKQIEDPVTLFTPEPDSKAESTRDRAFKTISPLLDFYSELFDKQLRDSLPNP